jgi:hypothetical protein
MINIIMQPANYIFKGLKQMRTVEEMQSTDMNEYQIESIVILPFFINTEANVPFLMYGFLKDTIGTQTGVRFITSDPTLINDIQDVAAVVDKSNAIFKDLLEQTFKYYEVSFKGLICKGGILFVMYDLNVPYVQLLSQKKSGFILATITEILNERAINDTRMHVDIGEFFSNTMSLCLLYDVKKEENDGASQSNMLATPCVFYSCTPAAKVEFDALFGMKKTVMSEYSDVPYYYFGNYEDTVDIAKHLGRLQNVQYGVIKYVVFLNKHTVILDEQDCVNWKEDYYDSAVILEDEVVNDNNNRQMILAVKNRSQFTTVSYAMV